MQAAFEMLDDVETGRMIDGGGGGVEGTTAEH